MSQDRSGSCIVVQGISKGQLLFRKALRKSGRSPVDFPGFLMAFLLIWKRKKKVVDIVRFKTFQKENHLSKSLNAFFILSFNPFYRCHLLGKVQTTFVLPYRIQQKLVPLQYWSTNDTLVLPLVL